VSAVVFKPDEIGDFVMATGAIRLLARFHGEEETTLLVKTEVASLARREFPRAKVIALPWQAKRKGYNRTLVNLRGCFPVWLRLRGVRCDQCVCLRTRRSFIQSALFGAPRAGQRIASENVLAKTGGMRRRLLEASMALLARPHLTPYPSGDPELPDELASHRSVVSMALGREVTADEIMPLLPSAAWRGGGGLLLCPFSSRTAKDYCVSRWSAALQKASLQGDLPPLLLAGAPDQRTRLQDFAATLRVFGLSCRVADSVSLEKFPELVARADAVLTVDTAAAHFACACRAPAVIVACGLHYGTYGPYSADGRQVWLSGDWAGRGRDGWQETVPVSAVASAIRRVMRL
jgi:ADP-heptose:LPS heptosyltransferase